MIVFECWERERYEAELQYFADFFRRDGDRLPLEQVLYVRRGGRHESVTFLLVQSPDGLAYESIERVGFVPETKALVQFAPAERPPAEYWRVLV